MEYQHTISKSYNSYTLIYLGLMYVICPTPDRLRGGGRSDITGSTWIQSSARVLSSLLYYLESWTLLAHTFNKDDHHFGLSSVYNVRSPKVVTFGKIPKIALGIYVI